MAKLVWTLLLCCLIVAEVAGSDSAWKGPSFREFTGVSQGNPGGPLWDISLSYDRHDLSWAKLEPKHGEWNQKFLDDFGARVLVHQRAGARVLPVLDYNSSWSYERGERSFIYGNRKWDYRPVGGDEIRVVQSQRKGGGSWQVVKESKSKGSNTWPLAAEHVNSWRNYVQRSVSFLRKAPYNVEYFQVWNEAHPMSGFWHGDMDTYFQRVHLPAAKAIRQLGGKVVYGGWPACGPIKEFVGLLDQHKAWDTVDVLDIHYLPISAMQQLHDEARKRGYDKSIWQTEIGFTPDPGFVGNLYPRALHWALTHNWDRPDKYKLFLFAYWSPNDPKAYGYQRTLLSSKDLSFHGISMRTLGELLKGVPIRVYKGIKSEPRLAPEMNQSQSGMEAFAVEKRIVVAVHLAERNVRQVKLTLPGLAPEKIASVERCSLSGERQDLTPTLKRARRGVTVTVSADESAKSQVARWWNQRSAKVRTFFVVFNLNN